MATRLTGRWLNVSLPSDFLMLVYFPVVEILKRKSLSIIACLQLLHQKSSALAVSCPSQKRAQGGVWRVGGWRQWWREERNNTLQSGE
jgi:hypothetical protein